METTEGGRGSQFQRRERGDFHSIFILKTRRRYSGGRGYRTGRSGGLDGVKEDPKWGLSNV